MPKAFMKCCRSGGKVRTVHPKKGVNLPVCYKNGKSYAGEPKHKKLTKTIRKKGR